jgi:hypothetical protein
MVDRIDLLIAVIGIVVTVVGSSTARWIALSKKVDKEDLGRLESGLDRLEGKLDTLIMRFVPEHLPRPGQ